MEDLIFVVIFPKTLNVVGVGVGQSGEVWRSAGVL